MNALGEAIGELCKVMLPIPDELFPGNPRSETAICTLSSMGLLREIRDSGLLDQVAVAGRLLSENKGIDSMLNHLYENKGIRTVIVCGKEVWGHRAGHSLFKLHRHGTGPDGKIISSASPDPFLRVPDDTITHFRDNVTLVDMVGEADLGKITAALHQ